MNQAPPPTQPYRSSGEQALDRVKTELGAAKLSDPRLIAGLRCTSATRMTYVAGTVIHTTVARQATLVDEPLATPPAAPSMRIGTWHPEWPPQSSRDLVNRAIDVREAYEILACPRCNAAGRTPCGVCHGSGQMADAKTRKPTRCSGCQGHGTVACGQCRGACRLLRFLRIAQTVKVQKQISVYPSGAAGVPKGPRSGQISVEKPLGFTSQDAAVAWLTQNSAGLAPERVQELAAVACNPHAADDGKQIGWLSVQGSWFDGWELQCATGGVSKNYFVPDTVAHVVGPRLYSKRKLASVVGAATLLVVLLGGVLSYAAERQRQAEEAARTAEVARKAAEHQAHLAALRDALPGAIKDVDTALAGVDAMAEVKDATALQVRLVSLKTGLGRFDELVPKPPEVGQRLAKLDTSIKVLGDLVETVTAVNDAVGAMQTADEDVGKKDWIEADDLYAKAIGLWGTHPELMTALKLAGATGTMAAIDPAAQKAAVEAKRRRISGPVATARGQQENQERLSRVAAIKASLDSNDRASYESAKAKLADEAKECGRCQAGSAIATAATEINSMLKDWPIDIGSIQELKNRYADLRGHRVQLKGTLTVSTYYNCAYEEHGSWRSMELTELLGTSIHVYCSRGDPGCESIFQPLASGGSQRGTATLKYPSYNDVCAEDQATLAGWSH
jgi:hypothetical protein